METKFKCSYCPQVFISERQKDTHTRHAHIQLMESGADMDILTRETIRAFLLSDGTNEGLYAKARQANHWRATEARREATASSREANTIVMARNLSATPEEFADRIRQALPDNPILKGLPPNGARPVRALKAVNKKD